MKGTCRVCKQLTDLLDYRVPRRDYICAPCRRAEKIGEARRHRERNPGKLPGPPALPPEVTRAQVMTRVKTRQLIKRGKLRRGPCEVCGKKPAEAHHEDYSKPLDVRWLCRTHHRNLHDRLRRDRSAAIAT